MKIASIVGALTSSLLLATALTPAHAADMTIERALNPQRSRRTGFCITATIRAIASRRSRRSTPTTSRTSSRCSRSGSAASRAAAAMRHGNLEATPLVEDGIMYVPDGWGSVYAIDVTSGKKGTIKWKFDPGTDRAWAGDVACCGVNNRGVALWKDKVISVSLDGRLFAINKATGEMVWERKIADPALGEVLTHGAAGHSRHRHRRHRRRRIRHPRLHRGDRPQHRQGSCGAPIPFPAPASPATRPGRTARTAGSTAAARSGRPRPTIPTATPSTRASAMPARTGMPSTARATTSGRRACSRSVRTTARSNGASSTRRTIPMTSTRFPSTRSSTPRSTARIASSSCMPRATASSTRSTAANGSFVAGKQYVDQLNWTPGLDPKTGRAAQLRSDQRRPGLQCRQPRHPRRAQGQQALPGAFRRQELGADRLQSGARSALHSLDRRLQFHRDRRAEGYGRPGRLGEIARALHRRRHQDAGTSLRQHQSGRSRRPARSRRRSGSTIRTRRRAGDGRQSRVLRATRTARSPPTTPRPCKEVWSFNVGTGINAPPITYSVNGKQYVAVLVGSRQRAERHRRCRPSSRTRRRRRCCSCSACNRQTHVRVQPLTHRLKSCSLF